MLLDVITFAVFDFFFIFLCFHNIYLGREGRFEVFAFDIVKVFLVVLLCFFNLL